MIIVLLCKNHDKIGLHKNINRNHFKFYLGSGSVLVYHKGNVYFKPKGKLSFCNNLWYIFSFCHFLFCTNPIVLLFTMPSPSNIHQVVKQEFEFLEVVLRAKLPSSGLLYNVLKLGQSLDENEKISVQIFSDEPKASWSANTTTFMGIANVKGLPQNLVVFSGPKNGASKECILRLIAVLDWKRENQFEGIETSIAPIIIEEARKHGKLIEHETICIYYMEKNDALNIFDEKDLKLLASQPLQARSLQASDAGMVEDRWPEKHQGYYKMIEASINLCSSGGVYLPMPSDENEKSWKLVSFAVALPFGSIHAFHTEPDQRRKGYGKITMKILVQNIAKAGRIPLVQIYKTNDGSKSLNEGIGFKYSHDINLINFVPN